MLSGFGVEMLCLMRSPQPKATRKRGRSPAGATLPAGKAVAFFERDELFVAAIDAEAALRPPALPSEERAAAEAEPASPFQGALLRLYVPRDLLALLWPLEQQLQQGAALTSSLVPQFSQNFPYPLSRCLCSLAPLTSPLASVPLPGSTLLSLYLLVV